MFFSLVQADAAGFGIANREMAQDSAASGRDVGEIGLVDRFEKAVLLVEVIGSDLNLDIDLARLFARLECDRQVGFVRLERRGSFELFVKERQLVAQPVKAHRVEERARRDDAGAIADAPRRDREPVAVPAVGGMRIFVTVNPDAERPNANCPLAKRLQEILCHLRYLRPW